MMHLGLAPLLMAHPQVLTEAQPILQVLRVKALALAQVLGPGLPQLEQAEP